jgi:hypothetical protein
MKIKPHSSITGLVLYLQDDQGTDVATLRVPRESLSNLVVAAIQEVGADISEEAGEKILEVAAWIAKENAGS